METYLRPIYAWDAWANWSAGAKAFYYAQGLLLDAGPDAFFGRGAAGRILSYPLHNPLMQVWMGQWLGTFDEVFVKFWSPVYLLSMAVYLYCVARRETNGLFAFMMLVLFLSSPLMSYHSIEVYSDLILGAYLFFAVTSFFHAMRNRQTYWLLVGFFSADALFVKNEATAFIAPLYLSIFAYLWFTRKQLSLPKIIYSILLPLLLVLPWFIFKSTHNLSLYPEQFTINLAYHPGVLDKVIEEFLSLQNFNIIFVSLPVLMIIDGRPTREFLHLLFPVLFYMVFFVGLYALTLYNEYLMQGTIFFRNALTYYPLACLLVVLLLRKSSSSEPVLLPRSRRNLSR
jgi:4-amino-4-deoxy-L-arabinose transferase-like glycosyltransferase